MSVLTDVAQAASGPLSALISGWQTRRNIKKQHQANIAMADHNFRQNLDMWNRQNEYNAPAMQMARYKKAGLSPNLIYGSPQKAGLATQMPQYQAQAANYMAQQSFVNPGNTVDIALKVEELKQKRLKTQRDDWRTNAEIGQVHYVVDKHGVEHTFDTGVRQNPYQTKFYEDLNLQKRQRTNLEHTARQLGAQTKLIGAKEKTEGYVQSEKASRTALIEAERIFKQYENQLAKIGIFRHDEIEWRIIAKWLHDQGYKPGSNVWFGVAIAGYKYLKGASLLGLVRLASARKALGGVGRSGPAPIPKISPKFQDYQRMKRFDDFNRKYYDR